MFSSKSSIPSPLRADTSQDIISPPHSSIKILFSESHSRYLLVIDKKNIDSVKQFLSKKKISFGVLGKFSSDQINVRRKSKNLAKLKIDLVQKRYFNGLEDLLKHG